MSAANEVPSKFCISNANVCASCADVHVFVCRSAEQETSPCERTTQPQVIGTPLTLLPASKSGGAGRRRGGRRGKGRKWCQGWRTAPSLSPRTNSLCCVFTAWDIHDNDDFPILLISGRELKRRRFLCVFSPATQRFTVTALCHSFTVGTTLIHKQPSKIVCYWYNDMM